MFRITRKGLVVGMRVTVIDCNMVVILAIAGSPSYFTIDKVHSICILLDYIADTIVRAATVDTSITTVAATKAIVGIGWVRRQRCRVLMGLM